MSFWREFAWEAQQALSIIFWTPATALLCAIGAGALLALRLQEPFRRKLWRPYHWLIFTQLLFFPAAILVGVIWHVPLPVVTRPDVNPHASLLLDVLTYGSLVPWIFWIWHTKHFRWFALTLLAGQQLILFGAFEVAGMSISGSWM